MQIELTPFAPSRCIFKGNKNCPRTVVLQQENLPGGGVDKFIEAVFFCTEKDRLDNAQILSGNNGLNRANLNGVFTEGSAIGKILKDFNGNFPNVFTVVLENCREDIYVRANYFNITQQIFESESIFLNVSVF